MDRSVAHPDSVIEVVGVVPWRELEVDVKVVFSVAHGEWALLDRRRERVDVRPLVAKHAAKRLRTVQLLNRVEASLFVLLHDLAYEDEVCPTAALHLVRCAAVLAESRAEGSAVPEPSFLDDSVEEVVAADIRVSRVDLDEMVVGVDDGPLLDAGDDVIKLALLNKDAVVLPEVADEKLVFRKRNESVGVRQVVVDSVSDRPRVEADVVEESLSLRRPLGLVNTALDLDGGKGFAKHILDHVHDCLGAKCEPLHRAGRVEDGGVRRAVRAVVTAKIPTLVRIMSLHRRGVTFIRGLGDERNDLARTLRADNNVVYEMPNENLFGYNPTIGNMKTLTNLRIFFRRLSRFVREGRTLDAINNIVSGIFSNSLSMLMAGAIGLRMLR